VCGNQQPASTIPCARIEQAGARIVHQQRPQDVGIGSVRIDGIEQITEERQLTVAVAFLRKA